MGIHHQVHTAINKFGVIKHISVASKSEEPFKCGVCLKELRIRKSNMGGYHFYHYTKRIKKTHDFSQHLSVQQILAKKLRSIGASVGQEIQVGSCIRADIIGYLNNNTVVFEVQRTRIKKEEVNRRALFYIKQHIKLVWVLIVENVQLYAKKYNISNWQSFIMATQKNVVIFSLKAGCIYDINNAYNISKNSMIFQSRKMTLSDFFVEKHKKKSQVHSDLRMFQKYTNFFQYNFIRRKVKKDFIWSVLYKNKVKYNDITRKIYMPCLGFLIFKESIFLMQLYIYCQLKFENKKNGNIASKCLELNLSFDEKLVEIQKVINRYEKMLEKKGLL